jgi:hypothetical protein
MGELSDKLKDPATHRAVVDDGVRVIEAEVASKGGLTGMAVKAAFKAVQSIKPGFVPMALHHLMPDFARQVDPFIDRWRREGGKDLKGFFVRNGREVANALLSITDERAKRAENRGVRKAYDSLRPQGLDHTVAAMPRLGELVAKYVRETP